MSPHIRIADGLLTQSAERLITTAGAIINGLTGNPSFLSPPVDLKTVQAAVDDLNARRNFGDRRHNLDISLSDRFALSGVFCDAEMAPIVNPRRSCFHTCSPISRLWRLLPNCQIMP